MSRTHRPARPLPWLLAVVALALAAVLSLAGCQTPRGDDDADPGAQPTTADPDDPVSSDDPVDEPTDPPADDEPVAPVPVDITVSVDATGEGTVTTSTLTCEPVGGDHPAADAACQAIARAGGAAAFDPTPPDVACTEQWGGPQTATVEGTVDGTAISAEFSRTNGCEMSRWDALEALLGPGGML